MNAVSRSIESRTWNQREGSDLNRVIEISCRLVREEENVSCWFRTDELPKRNAGDSGGSGKAYIVGERVERYQRPWGRQETQKSRGVRPLARHFSIFFNGC